MPVYTGPWSSLASDAWGTVTALVRQPSSAPIEGLTEVVVSDMLTMTDSKVFEGHDVLFNCIGTTLLRLCGFRNVHEGECTRRVWARYS